MNDSTQVARPESASHWYIVGNDIKTYHTVPYAGKRGKAGETRSTSLRDARKVGAFPSVTNVLAMLHKEFLVAYKVNQAILSCLTLPRIDGESEDDFAKRAVMDGKEHSASAARLGNRLHELGAEYLQDPMVNIGNAGERVEGRDLADMQLPLRGLIRRISPNGLCTEEEFSEFKVSHPIGYAGCCDGLQFIDNKDPIIYEKLVEAGYKDLADATAPPIIVCDLKSRGAAAMKPPVYETDILQLAAYLNAIPTTAGLGFSMGVANTPVANLLINTHPLAGQDGRWVADIVIHKKEEVEKAWEAFKSLHKVWCWAKKYDPAEIQAN